MEKKPGTFPTLPIKKRYFLILIPILGFLLLRYVLLQAPNTRLLYTIKKENLIDTVQVSGTYTTASQTQINSPSNGVVDKLFVENGEEVKKGDPLFHVESTATDDEKKSANATYLAAVSTLTAANADLYSLQSTMYSKWKTYYDLATNSTYENDDGSPNETNRVLPEFTTAQDDWLAAEAAFKNQQAVIAKDQASVASAKQAYDETQSVTVTAPIGGAVENLLVNSNDAVRANTSSNSSPVLVISNLSNPYISADISEDYAVHVKKGEPATIVFDALKNTVLSGKVLAVDMVGNTSDGVVTYTARIGVSSIPDGIKPGMTALITIQTLKKENVLDVPNSAIITKGQINYVILSGHNRPVPVRLGTQGVAKSEITSGVTPGTVIVANPSSEQ